MPEEPDNVVLMLLREIRSTQTDHGERLQHIEARVDEMHDSMITGLGWAAHANVRHETVEKRLTDLAERVKRLESRT